jgi:hypothetical protein
VKHGLYSNPFPRNKKNYQSAQTVSHTPTPHVSASNVYLGFRLAADTSVFHSKMKHDLYDHAVLLEDFIVSNDTRFVQNLSLGMCFENCHILLWFLSVHCECFSTFLVMRTPHKVSLTPC